MLRRTSLSLLRNTGVLVLAAQLMLTGCGQNGFPTDAGSPRASGLPGATGASGGPRSPEPLSSRGGLRANDVRTIPAPTAALVEESAKPAPTDEMTIIKAGAFELEIPAGSLAAPVVITVRDVSVTAGRIQCELLPHGLQFLKPVRLTVQIPEDYDPFQFLVFYIQPEGLGPESWLPLETRVAKNGKSIEAWLDHFSSYAPGSFEGKAGWRQIRRGLRSIQREP